MDALAAANNAVRSNNADSTESLLNLKLDGMILSESKKLATLCIAYHNTGVELEHLKRYEECLEKYEKALQVSEMFLPENREMAASFRQSYKAAKMIAAEHNIAHGRPKIPEKTVKRSKSSQSVRGNGGGRRKKPNFRSTQNLRSKSKRPQSAGVSRGNEIVTKISYDFVHDTKQIEPEGILPKVQRSSSEEERVESKDGTLEITTGATTVLLSGTPSQTDLDESRSREGELEKQLAIMQRRVAQLEAKLDPIENGSNIANSILFNKKLEEMHERRQEAITTTLGGSSRIKRKTKRRPQSASLARRNRNKKSYTGISSAKLSRSGMLLTGPGISGGEGPKLNSKGRKKRKKKKKLATVDIQDVAADDAHDIHIHEDHLDHITPTSKKKMDVAEVVPEIDEEKEDTQSSKKSSPPSSRPSSPEKNSDSRISLRSKSPSPTKRSPSKFQRTPQKLTGPALIKFFGSQSLSKFTLKRYLDAHHSNATFEDDRGISPLQALCMNDRVSMDMIDQYLQVHPAHIEEALIVSAVEGKTALHYLCSNRNATMQTAKVLISKNPAALNAADSDGKTPLIIAYERDKVKSTDESKKLVKYLIKRSSTAHATEELGNNQLHQVLMCQQRMNIKTGVAIEISKELITLNPGLLLLKNKVDVTPSDLGKTSMSKKLQKFVKKATDELVSKDLPNDALNLLEKAPPRKKKKKKKAKKSSTRENPFRDPPPNYETMPPREKEAKRVFYMLYEILEERHERPIIMFHRLDEDHLNCHSRRS